MSSSGEWLAGSFIIYFWNDSENRKFRLGVDASDFRCGWPTRQVAQARILTGVSGGPEWARRCPRLDVCLETAESYLSLNTVSSTAALCDS